MHYAFPSRLTVDGCAAAAQLRDANTLKTAKDQMLASKMTSCVIVNQLGHQTIRRTGYGHMPRLHHVRVRH